MAVTNNFASSELDLNGVISLSQPTALVWGPDGRLYVTEVNGLVKVLTVAFGDPDPSDGDAAPKFYVTEAFELTTITGFNYDDDGTYNPTVTEQGRERQVTGIEVVQQYDANGDPVFLADGKPAVDIYVTSSDPRHGAGNNGEDKNLDTNSGVVHRLRETDDVDNVATPDDAFTTVDLVRGFSRSEENHSINGLEVIQEFDEVTGQLVSERAIVAVGGNTNTGAPSNNFAAQQEYATSAGLFEINITMLDSMTVQTDAISGRDYIYDLPTLDDPSQIGTSDQNDPFGGNDGFNQAILLANDDPNNPVTLYSPGYRNAYDVEVTEDGRVWTYDNGANNSWGGRPIGEAGDNGDTSDFAQDPNYIATNLNNGDGNSNDEINLEAWDPSNLDNFHEVTRSDDLDPGETLSVGGNGPVTTYTDPDTGLTLVYGGHPNPTRAEGSKAGLLYSPTGTDDDAILLVSDTNTAGDAGAPSDYDDVIAWYTQVESDYGLAAGFLTKRVVEATPGTLYDLYEAADGTAIAVVAGGAAPGGAVLIGTSGLPSDIHNVVTTLNPIEGNYLEAGYADGALDSAFGSVNGLAEYTSTILDDAGSGTKMSGAILASTFNGGGLIVMGRNADGTMSSVSGANGAVAADRTVIVDSGQTLGLATIGDNIAELGLSNAFQGSIWAAVYKIGAGFSVDIEIFQPVGVGIPLADQIVIDPTDQDGDGIDVVNDPFEFSDTNGYDLAVGQTLNLDFEANTGAFAGSFAGIGLLGAALDGTTPNWDAQTADELFPVDLQRDGLFDDGGNIIPGGNAPVFQIKDVAEGTVVGAGNTARDAMHTGVNLDSDVKTLISTLNVKNWIPTLPGAPIEGQLTGMMFSDGTQSNFLRVVFGGVAGAGNNPGLEVGWELGDAGYTTLAQIPLPDLTLAANSEIELRLAVRNIGTTFDVTVEYKLASESSFTQVPLNGGAGFQLPAGVLQDVLTGSHTITDSDGPVASSGAAIGLLAETPPGSELLAIDFNNLAIEARGNDILATTGAEVGTAGTADVDTIVYTGTDTVLDPLAADVENFDGTESSADYAVIGNALENTIEVGEGTNTITTGAGDDNIVGTLAELAGDTITDMQIGDTVVITDLTLADAASVTYGGTGLAELTINGATLTFSGSDFVDFDPAFGGSVFSFAEGAEGLEITAIPPSVLETIVYRINFGEFGSVAAIDGGPDWADDDAAVAGFSSTVPNEFTTPLSAFNVDYDNVDASVVPTDVFRAEASDNTPGDAPSTLNFDVEIGRTYRIEYFYTENWQNIFGSEERVFDVEVEGAVPAAFDDINPLAEAEAFVVANGGQTIAAAGITNGSSNAAKDPYLNVARKAEYIYTATDDTLNLALIHQSQNPKVNAVQISVLGTPSTDALVSIGDTPAQIENGDTGTTIISLPLAVAEPGFTGALTLDFEVTVNGVTQTFLGQTINFVDTGAFLDVSVPSDIQNNGDDTVSVTLTGVAEQGYAIDGGAATGTSSVTEDDAPINPTFPFVEDTSSDLSDDRFNPTDFGQLAEGDNVLTATQQGDGEPGGRDRDYFTFEVADGQVLTQLILENYIPGETTGAQGGFLGLAAGATVELDPTTLGMGQHIPELLGGHVYDPTEIGSDLLPELADGEVFGVTTQGFALPLGPGVYTIWLNQGGEASTPTINLTTVLASSLPSVAIADAPTVVENGDVDATTLSFPVTLVPAEATTLTLSFTVDGVEATADVTFDALGNGVLSVDVPSDDVFTGTDVVDVILTAAGSGVPGDFYVIDSAGNAAMGMITEDDNIMATAPEGDFDNDTIANQDDTDIDGDGGGLADNSTSTDGLLDISETFVFDATNAGTALTAGEVVRLDFDIEGTPFMNGFTGALLSPNAQAVEVNLNAANVSGGTLNITTSKGDHFSQNNNQENAFVAAYTAPEGLAVETRFEIPDFDAATAGDQAPDNFQSVGVVIGTDQNNLVKAVWGRTGQVFQLFQDSAQGGGASDLVSAAGTTPAGAAEISIRLEVFLEDVDVGGVPTPTAKARAVATFYDLNGAVIIGYQNVSLGEITLEDNASNGNALKTLVESGAPLGAGVIQTSVGNGAPDNFDVSYQYVEVTALGGSGPVDTAPTVALTNTVATIPEDADVTSSVKMADITVTDDGVSTVTLGLTGADAALFEIVDNGGALELHLVAGAALDYETNPSLDVTVTATDSAGSGAAAFSATVEDVNEGPGGDPVVFELEDFDNVQPSNQSTPGEFFEEDQAAASGGKVARLGTDSTGTATLTLDLNDGVTFGPNNIEVAYFDEDDGVSTFTVNLNGTPIGTVTMDNDGGGNAAQSANLRTVTFDNVNLQNGSVITIDGVSDSGEFLRLDKITISPSQGVGPNEAPVAVGSIDLSGLTQGDTINVDLEGAAPVFVDPDGDTLIYTLSPNAPDFLGVVDGVLVNTREITNDDVIASQNAGPITVTMTASDTVESATVNFDVTVANANDAPVALTVAPLVLEASETPITPIDASAFFDDPDLAVLGSGETLSFSATGLPPTLSINPTTGQITGTVNQSAVYSIDITAMDLGGLSATANLVINASGDSLPSDPIRVQIESFDNIEDPDGFYVENQAAADEGQVARLGSTASGEATLDLNGVTGFAPGTFDLTIGFFDENDGNSSLTVIVRTTAGDEVVGVIDFDAETGGNAAQPESFREVTLSGVSLPAGAELVLAGVADSGEFMRLDYVDLIPTGPTEAMAILQAAQGVDSGASYNVNDFGSAELRILAGVNDVQTSNFGNNSFILENTGDKQIAAVVIDFRDALYGDSVIDTDGSSGDLVTKPFGVQSGASASGVIATGSNNVLSLADSYFFPGDEPNPDPDANAANGGFRGLLLRFDGSSGGFSSGEQIGFSGDMDANSVAAIAKSPLDNGAVNNWDVGGVSGAELIGSSFTVMFDDGTFATGYIGSDGSQAGSTGTATQAAAPTATATVTVNGTSSGSAGIYGGTEPVIVVNGTPGDTVLVTMSKGLNPVTNTTDGIAQDVAARLANAQPDFQVNNAGNFQTVQVTIGANGTATVPTGSFDYNAATGTGITFDGSAFTEAFATAPMVIAASVIDTNGQPAGPVDRVYLTSNGIPVSEDGGNNNSGSGDAFIEENGLLVIELESGDLVGDWADASNYSTSFSPNVNNPTGAAGDDFIVWEGSQFLNNATNGVIEYEIEITTPGTYAFQLRNQVGNGTASTEHNDTWLKINADQFYAVKGSINSPSSIVKPKEAAAGTFPNGAVDPEGSGDMGFFKVYSTGATNWKWSAFTSDNDPHKIYADFDAPGVYTIEVAARSSSHVLDRLVLSHVDLWTESQAQDLSLPESNRANANINPIAENDSAVLDGGSVLVDVLANDSDPDGGTPTITGIGVPSNGTAVVQNGEILYTGSPSGSSVLDSFTYTISDGQGGTDTATVTIEAGPSTPGGFNALSDMATTSLGEAVLIDVLANDTGGTGPYSVTSVTSASNGTVQIQGDSVLYTPNETALSETPIDAAFDTGADQFVFVDDLFRGTSSPSYATGNYQPGGGLTGGGLEVVVGGVDEVDIEDGMSGGWRQDVTITDGGHATLRFAYNLTAEDPYEPDEFGQVLYALDGVLVGTNGNDYIAQVAGGGTTGWQTVTLDLGELDAGVHSFDFGAFNNKKTTADEFTTVLFDDVTLSIVTQSDSFDYVATDADGDTDIATVIIDFDDFIL